MLAAKLLRFHWSHFPNAHARRFPRIFSERWGRGRNDARARLDGTALTDVEEIYRQTPFLGPDYHFGSRIAFLGDGTLVVPTGERGQRRERTVDIPTSSTSVGTTVRLNMDGSVPDDNPFAEDDEGTHEIYSYGHRIQQSMAIHPALGPLAPTTPTDICRLL